MIRIDMSEFQERHTVSRLVGAPPGYVGYEEAGQLTEAVRRTPYAVLLLDEIEKAHPDVFNILLQVLDDGRLTDGQGRTVDFKNTVVIMTSNLGSDLIGRRRLGFDGGGDGGHGGRQDAQAQDRIMSRLREAFRPEFLNRIDEIIVFRQLDETQLRQITSLLLEETVRRLHAQDITVDFTAGGGRLARPARIPARVRRPADAPDDPAGGGQPAVRHAARRRAQPGAARDRGRGRRRARVPRRRPRPGPGAAPGRPVRSGGRRAARVAR